MEVLFSFGSWKGFPFQGGYIIINAPTKTEAIRAFRSRFPDRTPGTLNCSDIYTDPKNIQEFKNSGNLGAGCHLYIDTAKTIASPLPDFCYTVIEDKNIFAMLRKGESGYFPIDTTFAGNCNLYSLADKLNQQFGISKQQEAAMLGGAMFGWDSPTADPNRYNKDGKIDKAKHTNFLIK